MADIGTTHQTAIDTRCPQNSDQWKPICKSCRGTGMYEGREKLCGTCDGTGNRAALRESVIGASNIASIRASLARNSIMNAVFGHASIPDNKAMEHGLSMEKVAIDAFVRSGEPMPTGLISNEPFDVTAHSGIDASHYNRSFALDPLDSEPGGSSRSLSFWPGNGSQSSSPETPKSLEWKTCGYCFGGGYIPDNPSKMCGACLGLGKMEPNEEREKRLQSIFAEDCAVCGKDASARCSLCKTVWYCGRKCQKTDWKAGHKEKCAKVTATPAAQ